MKIFHLTFSLHDGFNASSRRKKRKNEGKHSVLRETEYNVIHYEISNIIIQERKRQTKDYKTYFEEARSVA